MAQTVLFPHAEAPMSFLRIVLLLFAALLMSHAVVIRCATVAWAGAGEVLWDGRLDHGDDFGTAVAVHGTRVFAAGVSRNETGGSVHFVRAYDGRNGELVWAHESPDAFAPTLLAVHGSMLVAAAGNHLRAHDVRTGAVLWEDVLPIGPAIGRVISAVSAHEGLVVVTGFRFVRAYTAQTGRLLWQEQITSENLPDNLAVVTIAGGRVFVAGERSEGGEEGEFLLRAHDSRTGDVLWEAFGPHLSATIARAVVSHAGIVAVGGGREGAAFVRAYDAGSGVLLWQHDVPSADVLSQFITLAVHGSRLFAGGSRDRRFLVHAYDLRSGRLVWARESQADSGEAVDLTVSGGRLYVAGNDEDDWLVQAYDAGTGDVLWEDRLDNAGLSDAARSLETGRGELFVVGNVQTPSASRDFLIRAYDLR